MASQGMARSASVQFLKFFIIGAVVTAGIGLVAAIVSVVLDDGKISIMDAPIGHCFVFPASGESTTIELIEPLSCDEPHDAEIVGRGQLNPDGTLPYPRDEQLFALTEAACGEQRRFGDIGMGVLPVSPNELTWRQRNGAYVCVALTQEGEMVTGQQIDPDTGRPARSAVAVIASAPARAIGSVG